jgi:hypothetical protein
LSAATNVARKNESDVKWLVITGNDFSCLFLTSQFYFFVSGPSRQGRCVWFDRRSRKHHLESGLPYDASEGKERIARMGKGNTKTKRRDKYPFQPTQTFDYSHTLINFDRFLMLFSPLYFFVVLLRKVFSLNCDFNSITLRDFQLFP